MPSLNVVALISGGKDSLFSIVHCQANGYKVIALANLYPQAKATLEDTDSFMYQTIGHHIIPMYADALQLPLHREPITGTAINSHQTYSKVGANDENDKDTGDETESLLPLLRRVKLAHPDVNAVNSGAILSSYQRTRIENVALRVGMVPLAFLWQYPLLPSPSETSLLEAMRQAGMDARIIKAASGGLDESHLWLNVVESAVISRMARDMSCYGELDYGSVLGEGGEYETLAIDGPSPLWKKRIIIDERDREVVPSGSGTFSIKITKANLTDKNFTSSSSEIHIPQLFDDQFNSLLQKLETYKAPAISPFMLASQPDTMRNNLYINQPLVHATEDLVYISNLSSRQAGDVCDQTREILTQVSSKLAAHSLRPAHVLRTQIILRSMSNFALVNTLYGELFTEPNPPSRVTIACGDELPPGTMIDMSVLASKIAPSLRSGLHVQSQSYWAPANIGPYSQAIAQHLPSSTDMSEPSRLIHIAGQIPLVPASMELLEALFERQAALALQHLWRVGRAMKVHCWTGAVALITASDAAEGEERAGMATRLWQELHESANDTQDEASEPEYDGDFDVGDAQLIRPWLRANGIRKRELLASIPDTTRIRYAGQTGSMGCIVAQISELPRFAPIEWVSQGLSLGERERGRRAQVKYDSMLGALVQSCEVDGAKVTLHAAVAQDNEQVTKLMSIKHLRMVEAYTTRSINAEGRQWLTAQKAQIIPCKRVWNNKGEAVLALRYTTYTSSKG